MASVIVENGTTITNLVFTGFSVVNQGLLSPLPELLMIGSGSIKQLVIDALDSHNISDPIAQGQFWSVGAICGTGLLATGWEIPDFVMANGVPYISASTGLASIKIDGVVEPYESP